ncbi:hypothetical protein BX600DRAFT_447122, partial [Xylariales sp. PMI_506]
MVPWLLHPQNQTRQQHQDAGVSSTPIDMLTPPTTTAVGHHMLIDNGALPNYGFESTITPGFNSLAAMGANDLFGTALGHSLNVFGYGAAYARSPDFGLYLDPIPALATQPDPYWNVEDSNSQYSLADTTHQGNEPLDILAHNNLTIQADISMDELESFTLLEPPVTGVMCHAQAVMVGSKIEFSLVKKKISCPSSTGYLMAARWLEAWSVDVSSCIFQQEHCKKI